MTTIRLILIALLVSAGCSDDSGTTTPTSSSDSQGRVAALKKPHPDTGKPYITKQFHYGNGYTDLFNAEHIKTRYSYDEREHSGGLRPIYAYVATKLQQAP